jgi:hypothetical protein
MHAVLVAAGTGSLEGRPLHAALSSSRHYRTPLVANNIIILTSSSSAADEEEEEVIITMVAAALKPSATEAEAAAAVLANVSSIGKDEDNSSVDWKSPSTSLLMNRADDWRNEVDDKPLRREMVMKM